MVGWKFCLTLKFVSILKTDYLNSSLKLNVLNLKNKIGFPADTIRLSFKTLHLNYIWTKKYSYTICLYTILLYILYQKQFIYAYIFKYAGYNMYTYQSGMPISISNIIGSLYRIDRWIHPYQISSIIFQIFCCALLSSCFNNTYK